MRFILLTLYMAASVPMSFAAEGVFRVRWAMYEEQEYIADPVEIPAQNVPHLARVVLADNVGNFIGFVDESNVTIQFMLVAPGRVEIDIPEPASQGSFQLRVDSAKAFEVIDDLSPPFSRYKELLGLKYQTWGWGSDEGNRRRVPAE